MLNAKTQEFLLKVPFVYHFLVGSAGPIFTIFALIKAIEKCYPAVPILSNKVAGKKFFSLIFTYIKVFA